VKNLFPSIPDSMALKTNNHRTGHTTRIVQSPAVATEPAAYPAPQVASAAAPPRKTKPINPTSTA
jgi:hypothetical protein